MAETTPEPLLIKRYASRRLYNTETSDYVTLEDIARLHPGRARGADHRSQVGRRPDPAIPSADHRRARITGETRSAHERADRSGPQLHDPGAIGGPAIPGDELRHAARWPDKDAGQFHGSDVGHARCRSDESAAGGVPESSKRRPMAPERPIGEGNLRTGRKCRRRSPISSVSWPNFRNRCPR